MRRRCLARVLCLVCLITGSVSASNRPNQQPPASQVTAFLHVDVIPMHQDGILRNQTVLVQAGKITAIGSASTVAIPRNARRIEAKGKYLIPGLTDAHVHLLSENEFPLYLANGVTTVFNLDGRPAHLLWRQQVTSGELLGPTIFTTGPIFTRARTAEEDVRLVDEQAAAGYDGVKVYNSVSREEYPALIAEAKKKGMLLMGHVARRPDFEMTIHSGQSIAHLEEFTYTYFNPQHDDNYRHIVFDESKIPAVAKETAAAGIFVIPTLFTYATIVQEATELDRFLANPDLKYDAPWTIVSFQPAQNGYTNGFKPDDYPIIRNSLAFQRKLVKALQDAGVPLLSGTDSPDVGPISGFSVHEELRELANDGLTPFQVLQTSTLNAARYFHKSDEFGTIEVGKRADLVLLDQNPLQDISNTRKIAGVMVRGRWLPKPELARMVATVPGSYEKDERDIERLLETDPAGAEKYIASRDPLNKLSGLVISNLVERHGFPKLKEIVTGIRKTNPKSPLVAEAAINGLGYSLLAREKYADAIAVLRMNTEDFPQSANTFDSLAEACFKSGDATQALTNYKKALEINSKYPNAEFATKFVAEHGQTNSGQAAAEKKQ